MKMKTLVLGLDGASPEILLGDPSLENIQRLMEFGCHGRLESVVPSAAVPAWICMATGQDPGMLGVYGLRNRLDRSYAPPVLIDSRAVDAPALWDRMGGRSVVVGVPPNYPARQVQGLSVGGFLTPDTRAADFTHPSAAAEEIRALVGEYPVDVQEFRTADRDRLLEQALAMSRTQFRVVRHYLERADWDYFHFVEIGLDRVQRGFWSDHDPEHRRHQPDSPYRNVIGDYYRHLDHEISQVLELLDDETVVLIASTHGARHLEGGFALNDWLVREGLLSLGRRPSRVTPFTELDVDWGATTAWSEGGHVARVYLNVRGREPRGTVDPADFERVRDDLKARIEATTDPDGRPLGTVVHRPESIYREVRNIAPDLIVQLGGLAWRAVDSVGHPSVHVDEPDGCNPTGHGAFVLAAPGLGLAGEVRGAHLLDLAPTLLQLAGLDVPPSMLGRALSDRLTSAGSPTDEILIRDRLTGLGYLG